MVHTIVSRVASDASLAFWSARLGAEGVDVERTDCSLRFADPEGLRHELVVPTGGDLPLTAEHPSIPAEHALQGFEGVRAYSAHPEGSAAVLEQLMGATRPGVQDAWIGGDQTWGCAVSAAEAGSRSTLRRPSPAASRPAPSITWPGAPSTRSCPTGSRR